MTDEADTPTIQELNEALTRLKFAHGLCTDARQVERIGELIKQTQDLIVDLEKGLDTTS